MRWLLGLTSLIVLLALVALGCSKAPLPTKPEMGDKKTSPTSGKIYITAFQEDGLEVDSARVYFDGTFIGYTPVTRESISLGTHALRVQREGFKIYGDNIVVQDTNRVYIEALLQPLPSNKGQLLITVDQDSTTIIVTNVNNEILGNSQTREMSLVLDAGGYFVKAEKQGYAVVLRAVQVKIDSITVENISLEKLPDSTLPQIGLVLPDSGKVNQPVLIGWESSRADKVDIDYVDNPGLSGKREITFTTPGLREIEATAYNNAGQTSVKDTVYIYSEATPPPTVEVLVAPDTVKVNEVVYISWNAQWATSVYVDYVPNPGLSGQWQTRFTDPGEVVINARAYGPGGEAHHSVTLLVTETLPPTLNFEVTPKEANFSEPVHISWHSDGYQVIIDQGIGLRGPVGNEDIIFENPGKKVFTAVAYGENNLTTIKVDSVHIKEPEKPELPVITLAVVDSVEVGYPATIEWHSWYATDVDVDYVQNPGLNGKAELIFNTPGMRIITATAYNAAGQVTVADTLEVADYSPTTVNPIIISSNAKVGAIHHSLPQVVENAGQVNVKIAGLYKITASVWYNSGDDQKNESLFLVIRNGDGILRMPQDPNAGPYKVVPDDPGPPHVADRDAGTFYFTEGINTIQLHHYYTICEQYPQFLVDPPITGAESVEVISFKMEFVQP